MLLHSTYIEESSQVTFLDTESELQRQRNSELHIPEETYIRYLIFCNGFRIMN